MARPPTQSSPVHLRFAAFELDEANARLLRNGQAVAIAPTPFNLLCALARQPDLLWAKDDLLDAVWGHQFVSESVLKTAISDLRTVLGDDPRQPRFIETVPRRGYRFIAAPAALPPPIVAPTLDNSAAAQQSPSFIGRTDELARLHRAWAQATSGQRAVVWVAGEPGIGKTTLIEHFLSRLGGVTFARGQCVEHHGTGEPYLPVLEALAELCRKDAALPALLRTVAPTWLLQLPWLSSTEEREALRRELAGVGPDRMLREMGELLDRYTEQRPLLLLTEDLHWSDRATTQLINYLARRRGRACLMWLASFRVAEVIASDHPINAMRRELRLHGLCDEIVLDTFSETEVAQYVSRRAPSLAGNEAFVQALHERTDGVPLFVSSVIAEVMERAQQDADVDARLAALAVPDNLAAIIDHYIAQLRSEQRDLMEAAATCGVEFRVSTVAAALERDVASVAHDCEQLVREQLWLGAPREGDGAGAAEPPYAFRHALFRQVLYERTPPAARVQLHRRVGTALESERAAGIPVAAGELAVHHDRGRQPMKALRWYAEAARSALTHFSPADGAALAERALELVPQAPAGAERDALELTLATLQGISAFHVLGIGIDARNAFERAYKLLPEDGVHPMRGRMLHGYGYLLSLRAEYEQALEVADRAEALAAQAQDPVLTLSACLIRGEVLHQQASPAARTWIERGLDLCARFDLPVHDVFVADPQVTLLGLRGMELVRCGLVQQARDCLDRAHARARALGQPMTRLIAAWWDALLQVRLDDADRVARLATDMHALVEECALAQGRAAVRFFSGWAKARHGEPVEGYREIRQAYEENVALGMRTGASEVLGLATEALLLAGDAGAAQRELEQALQVARELAEGVYLPQLLLLQARIARSQGRAADALDAVRRAVDEARAQQAPWLELVARVELCAHDGAAPDDRRALRALVDRLPEAHDTGPVKRARALLPPE